tara:strand:+ start:799 stop:1095 length:297 start_codon:yes stop_codon:yes gene_type:complete
MNNDEKTMKKVLPRMVEEWIGMEDICFVTGKIIGRDDLSRFTYEFDAWVSEEGQRQIEERARGEEPDAEAEIMFREWYAQDEAKAANESNDEFRRWHK